jgi:hypothetical protein
MQDNTISWKQRFKSMKDFYGYSLEDISEITGNSYGSVRTVISSKDFPRWLKLAIVNYEMEREREIEKDPDFNPSIFENE